MAEITRARFELALTNLKSSDWERFEHLASAFLVDEWPRIRTMASYSGDGGRDSELFSPEGTTNVAIQYSLRKDYPAKIRETIKRLRGTFPDVNVLVYLTNQVIGAAVDDLKTRARQDGIFLDVRDLTWFADRANTTTNRAAVAEELARVITDSLLSRVEGRKGAGNVFTRQEAYTALTFLELQLSDDSREKGLTKSSFDALVRAALGRSNNDSRLTRIEILHKVCQLLPKHSEETLEPFVKSAIGRLSKSAITHNGADDTFCLNESELLRIQELAAEIELLNDEFDIDVLDISSSIESYINESNDDLLSCVRTIIGSYFLAKGEEFASAIANEEEIRVTKTDLSSVVIASLSQMPHVRFSSAIGNVEFLLRVIDNLFRDASQATQDYLKLLSDSYTIFAFLEETPDVQKATSKLFSESDVWLDTSVLLPVFAEAAFPETNRPFTTAFKQARNASMNLYVTPGVLEEIERHLNKCIAFTHSSNWQGRAPFVISQYLLSGKKPDSFPSWIEQFCGTHHPERDIAQYLAEEFGIDIVTETNRIELDAHLTNAVIDYWEEVQDKRRRSEGFNMSAHRLAAHDAENYLTVLNRRLRANESSSIGYKAWWLTMDTAAWQLIDRVDAELRLKIRHSPIMSVDFLLKYLAFGPNRARVAQADLAHTIIFGSNLVEAPKDLLEVARTVRAKSSGMTDRILQRKIRDAMDKARETIGPMQDGGLDNIGKTIGELY